VSREENYREQQECLHDGHGVKHRFLRLLELANKQAIPANEIDPL